MEKNIPHDLKNHVKIYANNDERMRQLGNILSTAKSRKIYQLLIENELNAKEIGKLLEQDENPRLPNLIYHLDKMVKVGLLTVKKRQQRKHGHVLKYYKAVSIIIILTPDQLEKVSNSKAFFNTLQKVFKFNLAALMLVISASFFSLGRFFSRLIFNKITLLTIQ